jgi:hypothetical protein
VKKTEKHKPRPRRNTGTDLRWTSLFVAFRDACEWALDVAAALAREYPEELEVVERVRTFLRARIAGEPADVAVDDVMFVFGLLLAAIERDLGTIGTRAWPLPYITFQFPTSSDWDAHIPHRLGGSGDRSPTQSQFIH